MTQSGRAAAAKTLPVLGAAHVGHAWLAAVLPAGATRLAVDDADLAETLHRAGADLVERGADVEIRSESKLEGVAPHVVVPVDAGAFASPLQGGRTARILTSAEVRRRARGVARRLRRRGYDHVDIVPWDLEQFVRLPQLAPSRRLSAAEYFPRYALVVGSRHRGVETVLERSSRDAALAAGFALDGEPPLLRAGTLVTIGTEGVLRLAVGPAERQIDAQDRALAALRAAEATAFVRARTPEVVAAGRSGIARWSLEGRLPGRPSPHDLPDGVLDDCVEFLVALHPLDGTERADLLRPWAELVAHAVAPADAEDLLTLASAADEELGALALGFGHGDFCTSNLLAQGDRLSGVVDWDAGGPGRLPLLDLFHLRLLAATRAAPYEWGAAVVAYLLPLAASGRDPVVDRYCSALELGLSRADLRHLAFGYWLQRVAYQLEMYVDRGRDREWLRRNIQEVLPHFVSGLPRERP